MTGPSRDVLTFRHVPTGVTGIPRLREWDAVVVVALPELVAAALAEFELAAPQEGRVVTVADEAVPPAVAERVAAALDEELDRPFAGVVVRQDALRWAAGGRSVRVGDSIELPDAPFDSLEVVRTPDGDVLVQADGEPLDEARAARFAAPADELARRGAARFESFVARADRGRAGRWHVTVDPL